MRQFVLFGMTLFLTLVGFVQANEEPEWVSLFDGKTLGCWVNAKNYGTGEITVAGGAIQLKEGLMATSIRYDGKKPFPQSNYLMEYVAERTHGNDFFAALTFPAKDRFCTFVNGGWGGTLVGLSSIHGMDASENSTSSYFDFKNNVRYRFRIAVTDKSILAWIDDELSVCTTVEEDSLSVRMEMELCKPLGFATWTSGGAIYSIRYRPLTKKEIEEQDKAATQNKQSGNPFHY